MPPIVADAIISFLRNCVYTKKPEDQTAGLDKEAIEVDHRQPVPGCEPDDQFAMFTRLRARRHNQTAIRSTREIGYAALDLFGVAHADRAKLHPQLRRSGLNCAQLP